MLNNLNLLSKCYKSPKKNKTFPLVGICISYNYLDTLKFMLPINYNHFNKIYLVTQEDDIKTIEYCKEYDNVELLLFNFKIIIRNLINMVV